MLDLLARAALVLLKLAIGGKVIFWLWAISRALQAT